MAPRLRTVAAVGLVGTAGWWLLDARRLYKTYPIQPPKDYHSTSGLQGAQPPGLGAPEVVYARIRGAPTTLLARPVDAYVDAFYASWTMRLEGWLFTKLGITSPRPPVHYIPDPNYPIQEYGGGFFPVIFRDPHALLVAFRPSHDPKANPPAGTQLLTAVADPEGGIELSYANYMLGPPAPQEPAWMVPVHRWYMRYLIDRAKRRLERECRV